jgi:hypothetical protein
LFGWFKKKAPTKAGLAYRNVGDFLKLHYQIEALGDAGGSDCSWMIRQNGKFLFFLNVWGCSPESSKVPDHSDEIAGLNWEFETMVDGQIDSALEAKVADAAKPFNFGSFEPYQINDPLEWKITHEFQRPLAFDPQNVLSILRDFEAACARSYALLDSNH